MLLTASSGHYQRWQTRVFFHHYTAIKAAHPCSDLGGFTRLLTLPDRLTLAEEDRGLSAVMTTIVARELTKARRGRVAECDGAVSSHERGVSRRRRTSASSCSTGQPRSAPCSRRGIPPPLAAPATHVRDSCPGPLRRRQLAARLAPDERHVFIVETDHVLLKPLPNLLATAVGGEEAAVGPPEHASATRDTPTHMLHAQHAHAAHVTCTCPRPAPQAAAYPFHYMDPRRPGCAPIVRRHAGSAEAAARVQQVGPSPLLISLEALRLLIVY